MHSLAGDNTWRCMVCKRHDRPFDAISIAHRPPPPRYADVIDRVNVAYCNDNAECTAVATAAGPWPFGGDQDSTGEQQP